MALKDTMKKMENLLNEMTEDLAKASKGNKAAAQRVRTNSIKFAKTAKTFRKESVAAEKKGTLKKTTSAKKTKKAPAKKTGKKPAKKTVKKPAKKTSKKSKK